MIRKYPKDSVLDTPIKEQVGEREREREGWEE